jgi:Uncharacterized conserved protein
LMCGRYNMGQPLKEKIKEVLPPPEYDQIAFGETFPSNYAAVKLKEGYRSIKWGVKTDWSKSLIINARLETIQEKPFFRKDFITNRCVVLATSYFEWNNKQKYEIWTSNGILYMAGLIKEIDGKEEFVILTEEAQEDIKWLHDRMPVILTEWQAESYLEGDDIRIRNHEFRIRDVE